MLRLALTHPIAPWCAAFSVLALLPFLFPSNGSIIILNQMGITVIFALSYNVLLGQTGLLSFGHSVFMGIGGFACIHVLKSVASGDWDIPLPLLPILSGLFSATIAAIIGSFQTRRSGTTFAMISLGIVELTASLAIIIGAFFGMGGMSADRTLAPAVFGANFAQQSQVYWIVAGWVLFSLAALYGLTQTPLGRMANAVRDNPDRAEYLGYSTTRIRFSSFLIAGFFAGVAGGLSAITFEIASAENLTLEASGTILLVTFIGGTGFFLGPVLGAILFTLLQTVLSFETDLWQLYLGILFLACVMFFPDGLAGLIARHRVLLRSNRIKQLIAPYALFGGTALLALFSTVSLIEMIFFLRTAGPEDTSLTLFWTDLDPSTPTPWITALALLGLSFYALARTLPKFRAAWEQAQSPPKTPPLP